MLLPAVGPGAAGVRHADRRGARRTSRRRSATPSWRAACSASSSPRRTRAPTGRAARCPPRSRNTRSTTCATSRALRASLLETLAAKGRLAWLEEELAALANADALRVAPEDAWKQGQGPAGARSRSVSGSRRRSPPGASGAPIERNRPRGWILDDAEPARDRAAPAALARGAGGACRRCRNPWCASAAKNCWRWCARPASPIRRRRCRGASVRIPRRLALGEAAGRHRGRRREGSRDQRRSARHAARARKARRGQTRRQPAARLARGRRRREAASQRFDLRARARRARALRAALRADLRALLGLRPARRFGAASSPPCGAVRRTALRARLFALAGSARRCGARCFFGAA